MKRPLMVITCLFITGVIASSHFYKPSYPKGHVVSYLQDAGDSKNICQGWIDSLPTTTEGENLRLLVTLDGCRDGDELKQLSGRVQLTVVPAAQDGSGRGEMAFSYGDVIRFYTHLHGPREFKNPGGFKYKRYCLSRGIDVLGFVDDSRWVTAIGRVEGHHIRKAIEGIRQRIGRTLSAIAEEEVRGVARALLIGDGTAISENIKDDFRKSGVAHVLVISGLNVGFVALFIFFAIKRLLLTVPSLAVRFNIYKPTALITIGCVWIYTYLTGAEASVARAAIMATVYLAGIVFDKRQDILTSLSLAALIILAANPWAVFDISFQLSFIAVLAITIIYPRLAEKSGWLVKKENESIFFVCRRVIMQTLAVSVAATIGVGPLLAYYFHYSSIAGIFTNIIVVPWAGFVLTPVSLVVEAVSAISTSLAHWPAVIFGYLIVPMIKVVSNAAVIARATLVSFTPPKLAVLMFYHIAIFVALWRYVRGAKYAIVLCGLIMIGSVGVQRGWFMDGKLSVSFLDVGQGSCAIVRFPTGRTMVVDGGGVVGSDFDVGKSVVAPYLWSKGVSKVDWLVNTHLHPDHYKGLLFLAENFSPRVFWWNGVDPEEEETSDWEEFKGRIKKSGLPVEIIRAGFEFEEGDIKVEVLNPPENIPPDWNTNNTSIVMRIIYEDESVLLTGDIEEEAEEVVSRQSLASLRFGRSGSVVSNQQPTTIFQVPHHGSSTSSTQGFLNAVRPTHAVIQAGEDNRFGFPHKDVLERLNAAGAKVYRTDTDGAVEFKSDGRKFFLHPFR